MNDGLRLAIADILDGLGFRPHTSGRRARRMFDGADTLRWVDRRQYGDPVLADEHERIVGELEGQIEDLQDELDERDLALSRATERGDLLAEAVSKAVGNYHVSKMRAGR